MRGRLTGVDFSQGMLDEARRRVGPNVELLKQDARALSFQSAFELVTSAGAFGHFVGKDEDALLDGIHRALVRGGRFVFLTSPMPARTSPAFWLASGFNAAMHVRNALVQPPFIMFYLTFTWPEARPTLERFGFTVSARDGLVEGRGSRIVAVTATRR
ncbi:MAG: class I SAM-dependent methyltransferase [Archangium sp.]|nr:class I SAM-dependent methyltransferase [Archangium sp.]